MTKHLPTNIDRRRTTFARELVASLTGEELHVMRAKAVLGRPGGVSAMVDKVRRADLAPVVDRLARAGWLRFANMEPDDSAPFGFFWPTTDAEWALSVAA